MRFSALLVVVSTFSAVLASPAGAETSKVPVLAYHPVKIENGRTTAVEGSPNGLYTYHNETHAAFHGTGLTDSAGESRSLTSRAAKFAGCDVSCNGQQGSASDIQAAESGIEGFFGSGLCWSKQIYYLYNSVYAFGCDYGHGQCETVDDFQQEVECIDNQCGNTQGGWNSVPASKCTYGREIGSFGC